LAVDSDDTRGGVEATDRDRDPRERFVDIFEIGG